MKAMMGRLSEMSARKFVLGSEFRLGDNRQPWLYSFTVKCCHADSRIMFAAFFTCHSHMNLTAKTVPRSCGFFCNLSFIFLDVSGPGFTFG